MNSKFLSAEQLNTILKLICDIDNFVNSHAISQNREIAQKAVSDLYDNVYDELKDLRKQSNKK